MDKPTPPSAKATKEEQDAYAQALLNVVSLDYQKEQALKPAQKHVFTKKRLIFLAVSIILSILLGWAISAATKHPGSSTSQVINGAENFNNPNAY